MDDIIRWAWIALAGLGFLVVVAAWVTRPRASRHLCPSRIESWVGRALPWAWVWPRRCGFDLTGVDDGNLCPECGRACAERRRLRGRVGFRPTVLGALVLLSGLALPAALSLEDGSYVRALPTLALVVVEGPDPPLDHRRDVQFRNELDRRVSAKQVSGYAVRLLSDRLIEDLANDDEKLNADRAVDLLIRLWPDSRPAVDRMLASDDWQASRLAALVYRQNPPEVPSKDLIAVCVAELGRDPHPPQKRPVFMLRWDFIPATQFLIPYADAASAELGAALDSSDQMQRCLAAVVIAEGGAAEHDERAALILVEHLRDNSIEGDAALAARGLYSLGVAALPVLDANADDADEQLRLWARAIAAHIRGTPWSELEAGLESVRVCVRTRDPIRDKLWNLLFHCREFW